jgi:GNAT superfamily N-acetyltransferase
MPDPDDLNVFMICEQLVASAMTAMPAHLTVRRCTADDFAVWKAFPFDTDDDVSAYDGFMSAFFASAYAGREAAFFDATLFVCEPDGTPIATCGIWPAYGELTTVQWFKVRLSHEGRGIGRALLSLLLGGLRGDQFPVYLHTQPGSFRAIKLYSDFGFRIIVNERTGPRPNDHVAAIERLRELMPPAAFARLGTARASQHFEAVVEGTARIEF